MEKEDIKNFTLSELRQQMEKIGELAYRGDQIFSWLYKRGVSDFEAMTNLPRSLRRKISERYYIGAIHLSERLKSRDGTEKYLFRLKDGQFIETVLIPARARKTVCISTQVGCRFRCLFCASGANGFVRNLTPSEIVNQILVLSQVFNHRVTNCVLMGMGEPLDNYENVERAIRIMNEPKGMAIGARRITISTCGVIPGIERLGKMGLQVNLSVSLHATSNELRTKLMPINKKYPLERLIAACRDFMKSSGRMITLEYILLRDINDSLASADRLAKIAKELKAKINLVPCSEIPACDFTSPDKQTLIKFWKRLTMKGVTATIRKSKGQDIQAACGQLAGRKRNEVQIGYL